MFLRKSLSNNKIYLLFVQGYRDENGNVKQKTVEKNGYLEDLKNYMNNQSNILKRLPTKEIVGELQN